MSRRYCRPYRITARFASKCTCGNPIAKGDRVLYFPNERKVECGQCAETTERRIAADDFDARFLGVQ